MLVKVFEIPVEIDSFNEDNLTIHTKQVPLPLRRVIHEILKYKKPVEVDDYILETTVEIDNRDFKATVMLVNNSSTIHTLSQKIHWISSELEMEEKIRKSKPNRSLVIKLGNEL